MDSTGSTIDFYLSHMRSTKAAKVFLGKALRQIKDYDKPNKINTDKAKSLWCNHCCIEKCVQKGSCYDNAPIESFWGALKNKLAFKNITSVRKKQWTKLNTVQVRSRFSYISFAARSQLVLFGHNSVSEFLQTV